VSGSTRVTDLEGLVRVADVHEFFARRIKRVEVEGEEMVFFAVGGAIYAVRNLCPHQLFSGLHVGILNGHEITCPMHGWTLDVRAGRATVGDGRLKCYEVKVFWNEVWVEKPSGDPGWG
jgi:nitrite reductase/ring-hydroxylating ferredoxin subunit